MSTVLQNLPDIRVGRDWWFAVTEQTALGNPLNMSGYAVELCIKTNITDSDAQALYKSPVLAGANLSFGQYAVKIPRATSALWVNSGPTASYEIIYQDPSGNLNTRFAGSVNLIPSITLVVP